MLRSEETQEVVHVALEEVVAEDLHVAEVLVGVLREHGGHVTHPWFAAAGAMGQEAVRVQAGLVLDQDLELLVFDGFSLMREGTQEYSRSYSWKGNAGRSYSGTACLLRGCFE